MESLESLIFHLEYLWSQWKKIAFQYSIFKLFCFNNHQMCIDVYLLTTDKELKCDERTLHISELI